MIGIAKLKSLLDTLRSNNIAHVVVNRNGNRKMTSENVMTTMLNLPPAVGKSAGLCRHLRECRPSS